MTRRLPFHGLACFVLVAAAMTYSGALIATPTDSARDNARNNARNNAAERPPSLHLAPPPGFDDDASFVRDAARRAEELMNAATRETVAQKRAELLLAAASLTLAQELEPACSRLIHHLPTDNGENDVAKERDDAEERDVAAEKAIVAGLGRVDQRLEQCDKILADAAVDDKNKNQWRALRRRRDTVSAFRGALGAFLSLPASTVSPVAPAAPVSPASTAPPARPSPDNTVHALRQAASGLAILLESDDPRINAAATLWQAQLRGRADNVDAAIRMLPLALALPRSQTQPYALFSRILRCELIARRGGEATSIALLVQLEERCDDWFPTVEVAGRARASVLWARHRVVQTWRDRMDAETYAQEREWCDEQMQDIRKELAAAGGQLLRLGDAIPLNTTAAPKNRPPHSADDDAKGAKDAKGD